MALAQQERIATRHMVDTASKQIATSVTLRHYAWLHSASISEDARYRIEDLPFDGVGLYDDKTDEILDNLIKLRKMAKSYTNQQNCPQNTWCHPYPHRHFPDRLTTQFVFCNNLSKRSSFTQNSVGLPRTL